jgi:type II secretory pathway predicted ATPase ExeA
MYEDFYNFREQPFAVPPDPEFLYLSKKHKKALSNLEYSIMNKAAFSIITGEIGSGKTTLVRALMGKLENDVAVGLVSNVNISSFEELMQWILFAFELEYRGKEKVELFEIFTDFVIDTYAANKRTVLIIDEAQNLTAEVLEQLRMLSNINVDKHQVLQLILAGQPNLWDTLRRPELSQFAQRIEVDYFLSALDPEETKEYIQHRLLVAGGRADLFTEDTYSLIWESTGGVPRLINILCGTALVYAFAEQKQRIGKDIINLVLADKKQNLSAHKERGAEPQLYNQETRRDDLEGSSINEYMQTEDNKKQSRATKKPKRRGKSTIEKLFMKDG